MLRRPGEAAAPTPDEFDAAFAPWAQASILLAVSGGPDSLALAAAACDWRARRPGLPLRAAIVDHGLRAGSRAEAEAAADQCARLGLPCGVLTWEGEKPRAAVQERARAARYALLAAAARAESADVVMTAHHADDQAETILFRLLRGSGPAGLAGMAASSRREGVEIARPFLAFPKARLVAFAQARGLAFSRDPSNADPRFARARLRPLMAALAPEGGTPARFARLADRARRADEALEASTDVAEAALARPDGYDAAGLFALPRELRLRLLARAVTKAGASAPRLERLEALEAGLSSAFAQAPGSTRRVSLAGWLIELRAGRVALRTAPPRKSPPVGSDQD